jgi:uracil DNA glycosylase superfamily protein
MEWDPGPPPAMRAVFEAAPLAEYESKPGRFRLEWGPMYYRGRLDGSAKVLIVGQDPAASENVIRRILVGEAGQRVQRYLAKLGLTRSYVMVNSVLYSIFGQFDAEMQTFMDRPAVKGWRNSLLDAVAVPGIQAVIGFGKAAEHVVDSWPGAGAFKNSGRVFFLKHPTAQPDSAVLANWSSQLAAIASLVSPDSDGVQDVTPYPGPNFGPNDLLSIPLRDLGFGMPKWMGTSQIATRFKANQIPPEAISHPSILLISQGVNG